MATLKNVEPELASHVQWILDQEPNLWLESGWRSRWEQSVLWGKWQFGYRLYGRGGAIRRGYMPANPPGKSKHERNPAEACDVGAKFTDRMRRYFLMQQGGLHAPIQAEPHHMELAPLRKPLPIAQNASLINIKQEEEDMPKYADKFVWPNGDQVQVYPDGAVKCFGAKSFGSIFSLKPEQKTDFKTAVAVLPVNPHDSQAGYVVCNEDGDQYQFDQAWLNRK